MRRLYLFLFITVFFLSACQSSKQIKPILEETINFDLNTAFEMIKKKEDMIIELALREKVSILEYKRLEKAFAEEFGDRGNDILTMLFIHNMDAEPEADMIVQQNTLYPTVFHKGITISNAVINKNYYENDFFNQTSLRIKEEYIGDDEKLKDWSREYIFNQNENGEWKLNGFSGTLNFLGDEYSINYLPLNWSKN